MRAFIWVLILISFVSCKSKSERESQVENKKIRNSMHVYNVLEKQLKTGYNVFVDPQTDTSDMFAAFEVVDSILVINGYKKKSEIEFKKKVKEIFDFNGKEWEKEGFAFFNDMSNCKPLDGDFLYQLQYEGANKSRVFYISFKHQLIIPLIPIPALIEYKKKYPEFANMEDSLPSEVKYLNGKMGSFKKWKDVNDLQSLRVENVQYVIALNMYLFNSNKAYLPFWLRNNGNLITSLLENFGYTKDSSFNKYVLTKESKDGANLFSENHDGKLNDYISLFFARDCKKQLVIRGDLLDFISENKDSSKIDMLKALYYAVSKIMHSDGKPILPTFQNATIEEKRKMIAYAALTFDSFFLEL